MAYTSVQEKLSDLFAEEEYDSYELLVEGIAKNKQELIQLEEKNKAAAADRKRLEVQRLEELLAKADSIIASSILQPVIN